MIKLQKSSTLSAKDWWKTLKTFILPSINTSFPPLKINDEIFIDECDKANILNNFFQSQTFLNEQNAVFPDLPVSASLNSQLNNILCSRLEVESVLNILTVGKASGPNGLKNRILREYQLNSLFPSALCLISPYEQVLFQHNIRKLTYVLCLKKGKMSVVSNYRPISLLNAESKVFERIVFKYLFYHLQDNNLLSSLQFGFMPGDSTVNQLTYLYNTFSQALDTGKEVRAVFCDSFRPCLALRTFT